MELAVQHHQAERLREAEAAYRAVLAAEPTCADAIHGLAILHWQLGRLDEAQRLVLQAINIDPTIWRYHLTHGLLASAAAATAEAAAAFQTACDLRPESVEAWTGLAAALQALGQFAAAATAYREAHALAPRDIAIRNSLGVALDAAGDAVAAVDVLREGLQQQPDYLPLYNNLGNALTRLRLFDDAVEILQLGLQRAPESAVLWFNCGNALAARGSDAEAVDAYDHALQIEPDNCPALVNLGNSLRALGNLTAAIDHYRRAIACAPDNPDAYNNMAVALQARGQADEAARVLREAIALNPDSSVAHNNLGNALKDIGQLDDAIAAYRRAMALAPDDPEPHGNLLYLLSFHPGYDEQALLHEAQRWGQRHAALPQAAHADHDAAPERRLRIGYVSPDFRDHCQAFFITPLFAHHDRQAVEIYCYADVAAPDAITERIAAYADVWRSIHGLSDAEAAALIYRDGIDILIDLTMHMARGRPLLFARKPAPLQIAWLAYPGTTGQPAIDYRLTDPWLDPPELGDDRYTEQSIWLPDTFWCYDPLTDGPPVNPLPAAANSAITFGCLNNFCKVTDQSLELWAQVLAALPASRLIVMSPEGAHRARVRDRLGVAPERLEFVSFRPRRQYLETYRRIDICLDTLPYNGHTTSLDAYWMGVPVVTRVGHTVVGRAGWSQLNNLGLTELAAFDDAGFVRTAVALAADLAALDQLRHTLRLRMQESPLMDGRKFAAAMEAIYRDVWRDWCAATHGPDRDIGSTNERE